MGHRLEEVVSYPDREMSPQEGAAFEAHLKGCEECRADLRAAEAALGTFDALIRQAPPPLDLEAALARVKQGMEEGRRSRHRRVRLVAAGGFALAAAILLALAFAVTRRPAPAARQLISQPQAPPPSQRLSAPLRPPEERKAAPAAPHDAG